MPGPFPALPQAREKSLGTRLTSDESYFIHKLLTSAHRWQKCARETLGAHDWICKVALSSTVIMTIALGKDLDQNCFMLKLDIKAAFRNIPVHPSYWELLEMKWQGLYFFDMVLPFGPYVVPTLSSTSSSRPLSGSFKTSSIFPRLFTFLMIFSS